MKLSDFTFDLPDDLIAQAPPAERGASRMLVLDRAAGTWQDRRFQDLPDYLRPDDRLLLNNTRVLPARLFGRRSGTTGLVETLLVKQLSDDSLDPDAVRWEALVRPGRKMRLGEIVEFPGGLSAEIVGRGDYGLRTLAFRPREGFFEAIERIGHMPLPPYIKRADSDDDRRRYQTVFAKRPGSSAAPTAGLHFTPEVLARCRDAGAQTVEITLHVGLGTFQPVRVDDVQSHRMHSETFEIGAAAARMLQDAPRIVAVGTTAVRTVETAARLGGGRIAACAGETDIFIYPGFEFQAVGAMLTNFHLPESTLLMLVSAFAGRDLTLAAYRHAVEQRYRFFSYGDCMLIL